MTNNSAVVQQRPMREALGRLFKKREPAPWMYHALLGALFLSFMLIPFEEKFPFGNLIIRLIYAMIILGALLLVSHRPVLFGVGVLLVFPSPIIRLIPSASTYSVAVADMATVALMGFVIVVLLARLLSHPVITLATISGTTAVYLLMGVTWTFLFMLLETLQPCSFGGMECFADASPGSEPPPQAFVALFYYSFVTITTLGYGDVLPVSDAARVVAVLEAVVGQLFLVILLARMVGLMGEPRGDASA